VTAAALEVVTGFGLRNFSVSRVFRPASVDELASLVPRLAAGGARVVFRGSGRSYGDATTNPEGPVVDVSALRTIHGIDEAGVVRAEAGATFDDLWRFAVPRGYWPPIVPGTSFPTLGGAIAMNIHGKNGWHAGTIGEHVESLTVLDANGQRLVLGKGDPAIRSVISCWGSDRPIVEVSLKLRKIASGFVDVKAVPTRTLSEMLQLLDAEKERWEYLVGWLDCFPEGKSLGRGSVHLARYVNDPVGGLSVEEQLAQKGLGSKVPKGVLVAGLRAFTFDSGMRLVNLAKYLSHRLAGVVTYRQTLVAYSFLFDQMPGFRDIYRPGGFVQYQLFVPKEHAERVFTEAIRRQHAAGVFSYLGVLKRHRKDGFASGYVPDGYSLALDFPVTDRNASALITLCRGYDALLRECGGTNYKAKDCVDSLPRRFVQAKDGA